MAIATLRRYLGSSEFAGDDPQSAYRRAIGLLLNGMVRQSAAGTQAEFDALTERMSEIAGEITEDCTPDRLTIGVGSAVETLEAYNERASQNASEREAELQNMMGMLAEAVTALAGPAGKSLEAFAEIRREIETASGPESVRGLKPQLAVCLTNLREEVSRQRAGAPSAPSSGDTATGLPQRAAAEEAIRAAMLVQGRKFLVTVVMDRVQAINARFGNGAGDLVLGEVAVHLRKHLTPADRLFRWTGPAITALVFRDESIERMRATIKRIFEVQVEREFDIGGLKVTLPMTAAWSVVGLIPPATNIYSYVDRFIASQPPRDLD